MSEELGLLLQMEQRTLKVILLLVGFLVASCIVQLAIVVDNFNPGEVHQYVERQLPQISTDTLLSVFKPALTVDNRPSTVPVTTDGELIWHVKNCLNTAVEQQKEQSWSFSDTPH